MTSRTVTFTSLLCTLSPLSAASGCERKTVEHSDAAAADGDNAEASRTDSATASSRTCDRDGAVVNFSGTDYDQSCTADSDCIAVPQGNVCLACIRKCHAGVVNSDSAAQYRADIAKVAPTESAAECFCPLEFEPCCVNGQCRNDRECG
jgi:hypothetical protein